MIGESQKSDFAITDFVFVSERCVLEGNKIKIVPRSVEMVQL